DPRRPNLRDLGLAVGRVRDDPRLRARERDRLVAEVVNRHGAEGARDPLADRDEHVVLARVRLGRDLVRETDELVRRVAHRGENADDAPALLTGPHEPAGDLFDLLRVADRRAAELHHGDVATALDGVGRELRDRLVFRRRHPYISRRPASARPSVTSSAYSRSPPTGRPLARR